MDCTDIHDTDSSTYCFALDLYKNQFSEIWYYEIINIIKELRVFVQRIMLKNMIMEWGLSQSITTPLTFVVSVSNQQRKVILPEQQM
jgi:hypothetical protein